MPGLSVLGALHDPQLRDIGDHRLAETPSSSVLWRPSRNINSFVIQSKKHGYSMVRACCESNDISRHDTAAEQKNIV